MTQQKCLRLGCAFESAEGGTVRSLVSGAGVDQFGERRVHCSQVANYLLDLGKVVECDLLDVSTGAGLIFVQAQQGPAIPDRETETPRVTEESELMDVVVIETSISGGIARWRNETDGFVVSNGLGGYPGF